MKTFLLSIVLFSLIGCATPAKVIVINDTVKTDCTNVQPLDWGQRGQSPESSLVWKCYDWEIKKQNN